MGTPPPLPPVSASHEYVVIAVVAPRVKETRVANEFRPQCHKVAVDIRLASATVEGESGMRVVATRWRPGGISLMYEMSMSPAIHVRYVKIGVSKLRLRFQEQSQLWMHQTALQITATALCCCGWNHSCSSVLFSSLIWMQVTSIITIVIAHCEGQD